jgi:ATP adenylyltransferase/5',5'''-P-1,P-4-tetraphosphate phosphorylase II
MAVWDADMTLRKLFPSRSTLQATIPISEVGTTINQDGKIAGAAQLHMDRSIIPFPFVTFETFVVQK